MTDTSFSTTYTSPRLERPAEAPLAGVCLALARTTGTDVVLWRVLFVVLCFFGGLGGALYLASYVSIPKEGEAHSLASRLLHGPDRRVTTKQVLLLGLVVIAAALAVHDNGGAVVVAGIAALGYVWWHRRHPDGATSAPYAASAPAASTAGPASAGASATKARRAPTAATAHEGVELVSAAPAEAPTAAPVSPAPVWVPPVAAPRRRSVLTRLTLSVTALAVGVLLLVAAAGGASIPTEVVLAAALGVVGLGLVASAVWGRARGLVPVALLLALALGGTVAARPALDHGIGERDWVAVSGTAAYRLGVGDATLKLTTTAADGSGIVAHVTLGHLLVLVPAGVHAVIDARVQTGDIQGPGDVDENGRDVHKRFELGPKAAPVVHVDARVGTGMVEVRSA